MLALLDEVEDAVGQGERQAGEADGGIAAEGGADGGGDEDVQLLVVRMHGRKMGLRVESLFGDEGAGHDSAKGAMVVNVSESSPAFGSVRTGDVVVSVASVEQGEVPSSRLD